MWSFVDWVHSIDPWMSSEHLLLLCVSLMTQMKLHRASNTLNTPGLQLDYLDKVLFENVYFMNLLLILYYALFPLH